MSVPKLKRETGTCWEINEGDEGAVETKTEETKEKKKKCVVETNMMKRRKNRGKSEEVDLDIWGVFWVFFYFLFFFIYFIYFFFFVRYLLSGRNPIFIPVCSKWLRYSRYLNRNEIRAFLYRPKHQYGKFQWYRLIRYEINFLGRQSINVVILLELNHSSTLLTGFEILLECREIMTIHNFLAPQGTLVNLEPQREATQVSPYLD